MATRVPQNAVGRQVLADHQIRRELHIIAAARRARHPNRAHRFWQAFTRPMR
ncbi:hypothetical protein ACLD0W_12770 [Alloalcanivorax sp. C16-1]|uniref:hypothetical protein n=1 Tax=Alloalcanivorax sp. C16-1 TaxID=3390051 RepID=UPI00397072D8